MRTSKGSAMVGMVLECSLSGGWIGEYVLDPIWVGVSAG